MNALKWPANWEGRNTRSKPSRAAVMEALAASSMGLACSTSNEFLLMQTEQRGSHMQTKFDLSAVLAPGQSHGTFFHVLIARARVLTSLCYHNGKSVHVT